MFQPKIEINFDFVSGGAEYQRNVSAAIDGGRLSVETSSVLAAYAEAARGREAEIFSLAQAIGACRLKSIWETKFQSSRGVSASLAALAATEGELEITRETQTVYVLAGEKLKIRANPIYAFVATDQALCDSFAHEYYHFLKSHTVLMERMLAKGFGNVSLANEAVDIVTNHALGLGRLEVLARRGIGFERRIYTAAALFGAALLEDRGEFYVGRQTVELAEHKYGVELREAVGDPEKVFDMIAGSTIRG